MTPRVRSFVLLVVIGAVLLGAGGLGAFFGIREYRRAGWRDAARANFEQRDWQAASINLSRYLPHDPSNIALLTMYADANAHILDDRPAALRSVAHAYHQILRYEPDNAEAQTRLLRLYKRQGAWDVLEYYAAEWLRKQPDNGPLLRARALALDKAGSRDDAIAAYENLFEHHAGDSTELSRYAGLIRERSGPPAAENFLEQLIERKPNDCEVLVAVGQYWLDARDVQSAKHYLALATEAAPKDAAQRLLRARIAASEQRWDEALALLDTPGQDSVAGAELVSLRANVLLAKGDAESAVSVLAQATPEVRIDHPRLQILLIETLYGMKRIDDARKAADVYLRAYPLDTATRNYVDGRQALAEERYTDAATALAIAVEMRPNFPAARLALAVSELQSGDASAGRGVLEAYLREYPADERARALWTNYFGMDIDEAERLAQASLDTESADANELIAAAELMANAAIRDGSLKDRAQPIVNLAERAARRAPDSAAAYQLMLGLRLHLGDVQRAREVLAAALAANVEPQALRKMAGTLALAEGDAERAWKEFELAAGGLDAGGFRIWARMFAAAGAYENAIQVLDRRESILDDAALSVDRAELAAEFGALEDAWNVLKASDPAHGERLNRARLQLAIRYADSTDADKRARLHDLAVRAGTSDDNAHALVLQALDRIHGESTGEENIDSLLQTAERLAPGDALVLDRMRAFFEKTNRLDRALDYAERACAAEPTNDRYGFELGRMQMLNGRFLEAERAMRDVLLRTPDNTAAGQILVQALLDSGQVEPAEQVLAGLSAGERTDRLHSRLLMARNANAEAEALLRKRVSASPGDRVARWEFANCLRQLGRADDAADVLRDATSAEDANAQDWSQLARFLAEQVTDTLLAEASRAALRALLIDPGHADALRTLAGIRERQHEPAAALAILRRYVSERTDDAAAWHRVAQLELATGGHWTDALNSIDKAYSITPDAAYRALRGFIHAGLENYSAAIEDLEEAAADLPATSVQFELTLAECYLHSNRIEQAEHRLAAAKRKLALAGTTENAKLAELTAALAALKNAE